MFKCEENRKFPQNILFHIKGYFEISVLEIAGVSCTLKIALLLVIPCSKL